MCSLALQHTIALFFFSSGLHVVQERGEEDGGEKGILKLGKGKCASVL